MYDTAGTAPQAGNGLGEQVARRIRGLNDRRRDGLIAAVEALVVRLLHLTVNAAARLIDVATSRETVSDDSLAIIPAGWTTRVDDTLLPEVATVWQETSQALLDDADAFGVDVPEQLLTPDASQFLASARNRLVGIGDDVWDTARKQLAAGVAAGEGVDELAARVAASAGLTQERAMLIARTEVIAASNAASLATASLLGEAGMVKEWLATPDARTRETHRVADGQRVPLTDQFTVGGAALMFPGDPTGPPDQVINCRCSIAYVFDQRQETVVDDTGQPIVAAAETHTGAMVALIPADTDAQRLAVDGGEPVDQLHVTVAYLGDAAGCPGHIRKRIISDLEDAAAGWPPLSADGFAISVFNPPGHTSMADGKDRDTCVTLGMSGDDLEDVYDTVSEVVQDAADPDEWTLPRQHSPWAPHMTLQYTDDVTRTVDLVDRAGPVTFDRLRVTFGDDTVDIPLTGEDLADDMADVVGDAEDDTDWDAYFNAAIQEFLQNDRPLREYWVHGKGALKIRWPQKGAFKRCVRQLRKYVRDPKGLCAVYYREANGRWPGSKKKHSAAALDVLQVDEPDQPMVEPDQPDQPAPMPEDGTGIGFAPGEHWHAIMHVEGVSTGLRTYTGLTWREPPFAFHWAIQSAAHGGTPETVQVGLVTRVERHGDAIHGWGTLDLGSDDGSEYARKLAAGFARWVSIGLDESFKESDIEYMWPDGADMFDTEPEEMLITSGRIGELTAVSVPAQQEAVVQPSPELLAVFDVVTEPMTAAAVGVHKTGTTDDPWDADMMVKRLPSPMPVETARDMYAWIDESRIQDGMIPKDACKFPHHQVSADGRPGAANLVGCSRTIGVLHGARGREPDIPDADRRGVYNHVAAHLRSADREVPDFTASSSPTVVVAAGHTITIPDVPPAGWFTEPDDVGVEGALTVTDGGRIYGYLAPAGIAHRSFTDRRVEVPMGNVDYSRWMGGEALVAGGGRVVAGPITMECGHLPPGASAASRVRMEHYDNTCSVVAKAAIGENRHGVWIAGALEPGVNAEQVSRMLACRLSGDWAPHPERPGWREFVAALLVPVPGFAMGRAAPSVMVSDGALVASVVPVRMADPALVVADTGVDLNPVMDYVARRIGRDAASRMASLRARVGRD